MFTSGCANKQPEEVIIYKIDYVFFIPEKITTPTKPVFKEYDPKYLLNQSPNFERVQQNTVLLKNYSNALRLTIDKYEALIDKMKEAKDGVQLTHQPIDSDIFKLKSDTVTATRKAE